MWEMYKISCDSLRYATFNWFSPVRKMVFCSLNWRQNITCSEKNRPSLVTNKLPWPLLYACARSTNELAMWFILSVYTGYPRNNLPTVFSYIFTIFDLTLSTLTLLIILVEKDFKFDLWITALGSAKAQ